MASNVDLPSRLPLLILEDKVLLPGSSMRIAIRDSASIRMMDSRLLKRDLLRSVLVGVVPRRSNEEHSSQSLVNTLGTAAVVVQVTGTNWPKPLYTLLVTGLCRFRIDSIIQEVPFLIGNITQMDSPSKQDHLSFPRVSFLCLMVVYEKTHEYGYNQNKESYPQEIDTWSEMGKHYAQEMDIKKNAELTSIAVEFRILAEDIVDMLDGKIPVITRLKEMLTALPDHSLPDTLASIVKATFDEKLEVLNTTDLVERFKKALRLLKRQQAGLKLGEPVTKISRSSDPKKTKQMRKFGGGSFPIRINKGFDDDDNDDEDDIEELEGKIKAAELPEHALKVAMKELKRLKKMPPQFPEHATTRNYLEWMTDLPWSKETKDKLDIAQARHDLDQDHYGLEKLKRRVIEYLAVRKLKNSLKGPILCFVGPPGVGKTSVGRSIANTLGREFHRISLGGIHDQSDIRGHRRTYVGSMPGRILTALKSVGVKNPVILLDEIDKLTKSLHGDPSAALLEVLDPEQNWTFVDHYLNLPFDLSQVLFIATANSISTIPPALLDRMELIQVPGYTQEEKLAIATRHLIPKQFKSHGLKQDDVQFSQDAVKTIISSYTREAGVRSLERKLGALCRSVAVKFAEKNSTDFESKDKEDVQSEESGAGDFKAVVNDSGGIQAPFTITKEFVVEVLGPPIFESEVAQRLAVPGVATGLAWTAMGGEIMFVEATRMGGEGQLTLTGQLGDVMKESAQLALSWLRSHAVEYDLASDHEVDLVGRTDIHVHFPAGAVGKDGPSAGLAIVVALVSLFSGRCTRSDTAMTGEITLRGLVLPVGGIKEKILSAHRAGITRVILPKRNEKDLREIPENVKSDLEIITVHRVEEALQAAFEDGFPFLRITNIVGRSKL